MENKINQTVYGVGDAKHKPFADLEQIKSKLQPGREIVESAKSVGAQAAGFEFPVDIWNAYTGNGKDKKAADRLIKYQAEIAKKIAESEEEGKTVDYRTFALEYLSSGRKSIPKKLVEILQNVPVISERRELPDSAEFGKEITLSGEDIAEKMKAVTIETQEELFDFLRSLGEATVVATNGQHCYFPAYLSRLKRIFSGKEALEEIEIIPLRVAVKKIMNKLPRELEGKLVEEKFKEKYGKLFGKNWFSPDGNSWLFFRGYDAKTGMAKVVVGQGEEKGTKRFLKVPQELDDLLEQYLVMENTKKSDILTGSEDETKKEMKGFEKDGKEYLAYLKREIDWSKYDYDQDQQKDLLRIELETFLKDVIEKESKFFKDRAKKVSKELAKQIIG